MKKLAPIVLFVYNRPDKTKNVLDSLKECNLAQESDLYIFSDGPKNHEDKIKVDRVREIIKEQKGFNRITIYEKDVNKGLARSVIDGVTYIINKYGKVIVLEDDLKFSVNFLEFMNNALEYYNNDDDVWSISGFSPNITIPNGYKYDVYKVQRGCSWGWATWKTKWDSVDWEISDYNEFIKNKNRKRYFNSVGNNLVNMLKDYKKGHIDSWAVRWYYNQYKYKKYTIYPVESLVENKGFKGDSTHGSISNKFGDVVAIDKVIKLSNVPVNLEISSSFSGYFNLNYTNYVGILLKKIGIFKPVKRLYKKISSM